MIERLSLEVQASSWDRIKAPWRYGPDSLRGRITTSVADVVYSCIVQARLQRKKVCDKVKPELEHPTRAVIEFGCTFLNLVSFDLCQRELLLFALWYPSPPISSQTRPQLKPLETTLEIFRTRSSSTAMNPVPEQILELIQRRLREVSRRWMLLGLVPVKVPFASRPPLGFFASSGTLGSQSKRPGFHSGIYQRSSASAATTVTTTIITIARYDIPLGQKVTAGRVRAGR